ncbi:hypothetical protein ACLOJK_003970 [Asimina triloba]
MGSVGADGAWTSARTLLVGVSVWHHHGPAAGLIERDGRRDCGHRIVAGPRDGHELPAWTLTVGCCGGDGGRLERDGRSMQPRVVVRRMELDGSAADGGPLSLARGTLAVGSGSADARGGGGVMGFGRWNGGCWLADVGRRSDLKKRDRDRCVVPIILGDLDLPCMSSPDYPSPAAMAAGLRRMMEHRIRCSGGGLNS